MCSCVCVCMCVGVGVCVCVCVRVCVCRQSIRRGSIILDLSIEVPGPPALKSCNHYLYQYININIRRVHDLKVPPLALSNRDIIVNINVIYMSIHTILNMNILTITVVRASR